jgi:DNA-directed RNA polymerase, beta subunit/140 kD subunit
MSKEQEVVEAYRKKYEGNNAKYAATIARNDRIDFSKISGDTALPYLVEIQTDSFKWFIEKGLDEVLKEVFPIANYSNTVFIDYVNCHFEAPEYGPLECKEGDLTYSSKLKVTLRLRNKQTGEIKEDNEVFMGDVPMMTDSGTFVVNGAERVIVSQIVRSPGAYFQDTADKSGAHTYNGEIIPTRGTWLQFESDLKGVMWVRIDRQRKMPATILFKALGIDSEKAITDLFGNSDSMKLTLAKDSAIHNGTEALIDIFKKLKPGEPITQDGVVNFLVQKFFDDKRYDLGRAGRFKYATKLGVYDRLYGRVLAENLVSADGEIFTNKAGEAFVKDYKLTKEDVQELRDAEFFEKGAHLKKVKVNEKLDTFSNVTIVKVYANDKKEDGVTNIIGTDLSLNGDETHPSVSRVTISDMIACFSYFCNIQDGIGQTDDIDHLGNRRVRCVGELLQTQFRIGLTKMSKTVQQKMSITDLDTAKPQALVNIRPLTSSIREFFASSQLSQFMVK